MGQNLLTTFSIVAISQIESDDKYYLTSKSFIRDEIFLNSQLSDKNYENCLFYLEIDENSRDYKSTIEFGQKIYFRHKISNKYLSHSDDFEEEENDTTFQLKLSHKKHHFKILPCFQYQTKISSRIRFNEEIQLVTEINGAKTGYISSRKTQASYIKKTIIGLNSYGSSLKFSFHSYYQFEKQEINYTFGSMFWLQHVESQTFLSTQAINDKKQVVFEPIDQEKDLQSINGLWLIESNNMGVGGRLAYEQKFKLKNLSSETYFSFTKGYKMVENQKIYGMVLQDIPIKYSNFSFLSLKEEKNIIKKGSYLIFTNFESKFFIGARKDNVFWDTQLLKPISYQYETDQDLFKIVELNQNEEEAIRFILSIGHETTIVLESPSIEKTDMKQGREIFENIRLEIQKLKKFGKLFQKVQGQMKQYIESFCLILKKFRSQIDRQGDNLSQIVPILKNIYSILTLICSQNRANQIESCRFLNYYIEDIFLDVGAENILIQTFRDNQQILCKVPKIIKGINNNIVRASLNIVKKYSHNKDEEYWRKILKFIQFLKTLIISGSSHIDINQRLVSEEFFSGNDFNELFFGIKIINSRIKIEQYPLQFNDLERIKKDKKIIAVIEEIFKLLSLLCSQRNFISKKYINSLLNPSNKNIIEVLIAYLSLPISQNLIDTLYSLITNLYIDSSPRIERLKPLAVINFVLDKKEEKQKFSMREQTEMAERLNSMLQFKAEQAYKTRPLQISNILAFTLNMSMQPSLSNQELAFYKEQLLQKINENTISLELLKSLKILIALESVSGKQILEINSVLSKKLQSPNISDNIIIGIMDIFLQVCKYSKEVALKKMAAYLKFKYRKKEIAINYEKQYEYLMPYNKRLRPSKSYPPEINDSILQYNNQTDMVNILTPIQETKDILFQLLITANLKNLLHNIPLKKQENIYSHEIIQSMVNQMANRDLYMEKIYDCFIGFNFMQRQYLELVMNSIVLTKQEVPVFENLFDYYKKLKHLVAISEYWLNSDGGNKDNLNNFIKYLAQVTQHFHKDYEEKETSDKYRMRRNYTDTIVKEEQIYVNRQLLLRNIGFHEVVLELIKPNHYLLPEESTHNSEKSQHSQIAEQVFSLCFQFLYGFIFNCQQNKEILHHQNVVLLKYQKRAETGQIRVLQELYRGKIEYISQLNAGIFEELIHGKILKNPKSKTNQGNQFDPKYLNFLESIIKVNGKIYRPNLQKFYKAIEKDIYFRKIIFAKENNNAKLELCLSIYEIKLKENIQIPFIYHTKILGFLADMFTHLESHSTVIASKIRDLLDIEYLLEQLYNIDIYTHNGVEAQMRFLLKLQVIRIVSIYLEKNETINVLLNSGHLKKLVQFYETTFIVRKPKENCEFPNEALYVSYLEEYKKTISYYENNQRQYFLKQIHPFLQKIYQLFVKAKKHTNNPICDQILFILENNQPQEMVENYEYRIDRKKDKIAFKWLNYVDNDENNGPDEKFAKLAVVDLLRNKSVEKIVAKQQEQFYGTVIAKNKVRYFQVLIELMNKMMEKKSLENEAEADYLRIKRYLNHFYDLLNSLSSQQEKQTLGSFLLDKQVLRMFIDYTTRAEFDFKKYIAKIIFYQIIKILGIILNMIPELKAIKEFYKIFNQQTSMPLYRFWQYLHENILAIKSISQSQAVEQQINQCLKNIYMIPEERKQNFYCKSIFLIETLCEYYPFTSFLRHQPYSFSVDFLEIMYHSLNYIICWESSKAKINTYICDAAETLSKGISSMMLGGNQLNQNYLIDNKFSEILNEVLKLERIHVTEDKAFEVERQRQILSVIQFYNSNGIDMSASIRKRIRIKDFNHPYILNRLKFSLLNTLLECISANQMCLNKVKFQIPLQLLKINLIWVYEDYLEGSCMYEEQYILRELEEWQVLIDDEKLSQMFLMIGFQIYYLIQNNEAKDENKNDEDDVVIDDKEKRKQKIVKNFFGAISEKDKREEKQKKLENEPFAEEMKMFYNKYYQSLEFFRKKTLTIEVNFNDNLTRVFFPEIPLCQKLTVGMMNQFKENAVRISQEEKLKSLMKYEEESYDFLQGEQDFFEKFQKVPCIEKFLRKLNQDFLRLAALIMCFIQTILFLVEDFNAPSFIFDQKIFNPDTLTSLGICILIIGTINLLIGFLLLFYLVFKKMPILIQVISLRQKKRDQNQRKSLTNGKYGYMFKQIAPEFMFTLIYIGCLVCTFIHPFFAGFILFDIMSRLQLGRQISRSIRQTFVTLLGTLALLIIINYFYALYVYIQFTQFFSPVCEHLFQCILLLLDQALKSDSGFLGSTPVEYGKNVFDLKFFSEMLYIIFAQKVIFEIFSGTIIDKFSELREENNDVIEDENSMCYICGQERFYIDFELEGFDEHIEINHKTRNYLCYLFYLRRKNPKTYGIVERYISECQKKSIKTWIPDETSIYKIEKEKLKKGDEEQDENEQIKEYIQRKIRQTKQIRFKSDQIISELKLSISKLPQTSKV